MSEMDAKIAAAEARTDTKFSEMLGELKAINLRMGHIEATTSGITSTVVTTVVATGFAAVALTAAIVAYGSQMFGTGMDADTIARQAAQHVSQQTAGELLNLRMDIERTSNQVEAMFQALQADIGPIKVPESPEGEFQPAPAPNDALPMPQIAPQQ